MLPPGLPFLSGRRLTVISSPGLNESLLQPFPIMLMGACASPTQCATSPLSATSNLRRQCGLAQNHSVTVPFTVTLFSVSNTALAWCAKRGVTPISRPKVRTSTGTCRFRIAIASIEPLGTTLTEGPEAAQAELKNPVARPPAASVSSDAPRQVTRQKSRIVSIECQSAALRV